jgi:hypothetical protein
MVPFWATLTLALSPERLALVPHPLLKSKQTAPQMAPSDLMFLKVRFFMRVSLYLAMGCSLIRVSPHCAFGELSLARGELSKGAPGFKRPEAVSQKGLEKRKAQEFLCSWA